VGLLDRVRDRDTNGHAAPAKPKAAPAAEESGPVGQTSERPAAMVPRPAQGVKPKKEAVAGPDPTKELKVRIHSELI
jgi:hypothetical protein